MRTPLAILLACAAGAAHAQSVERLGTLGGTGSIARDINDFGQIVGESTLPGDLVARATIWNNGLPSELGGLNAGDNSVAWAINNQGVAVGTNDLPSGVRTATIFQNGAVTDLGSSIGAGSTGSVAWDINDAGVVVGQAAINPGFSKGFVWDETNGVAVAGTIPGYMGGANLAINNANTIVGHSFFFGDPNVATLALPDGRGGYASSNIGPEGFSFSIASAISDSGIIAGFTNGGGLGGPNGEWQAAIFVPGERGTEYIPLGFMPGLSNSEANDVNDSGLVVGYGFDGTGAGIAPRAFAWLGGVMTDLNDLLGPDSDLVQLYQATGVNDQGDIVGFGETRDGSLAGFVIEGFVPAPGTCAFVATAGLLAIRRRRRS